MSGWRKKATVAAALLALLLAAAALAAHMLFDEEGLKTMARDRARTEWSRELVIDTLSLRLFPVPGLRATGIALSAPAWAHAPQLAAAELVDASLSWRALLSGRIAPGALRIEGGHLSLERAADGRRSWDLGSRDGALDWRQLVRADIAGMDIHYREDDGAPRTWRLARLAASAAPNWQDLRVDATVDHAQQSMTLRARLADLSGAGVDDAFTDGEVAASWPSAQFEVKGALPLSPTGGGTAATVALEAQSMDAVLRFFDIAADRPLKAPLSVHATLRGDAGKLAVSGLRARLGQTEASGELQVRREHGRVKVEGALASPAIDWATLTREAGRPPPPPIPKDELFRHHPLAWGLVDALDGIDTALTLDVQALTLRSGIRLAGVSATLQSRDDKVDLPAFSMQLLGGKASGGLKLVGARRSAQLRLAASGVRLERFFSERGRKVPVSGGPMQVDATVSGRGASLREMAGTLAGLATIRGGATLVRSEKAGEVESLLTSMTALLSEKNAPQIRLSCFAGRLPFSNGVAGNAAVGARSEVSKLLTSGTVDLKRQRVELKGRVRARDGISLGIAALSGDVSIAGPLRKPKMSLDPVGTPSALARLGAAIVTGGLSLVATAAWDAANPGPDPCEAVFSDSR
nr:AsmA family protein [uncultured Noviherbaspirillum sp.]